MKRLVAAALTLAWALSATAAQAQIVTWAEGSWSWFGDPRAVQVGGATFVGWIDWSGRVMVGELDRSSGATRAVVVARVYHDDHSDPSILVEPDDRLTVFWSGHNGAHMYYRTTLAPGDISAWTAVRTLQQSIRGPDGFTYPNPVLLPAEADRPYLFWRGADWSADFATRAPSGNWSGAHELIRSPGQRPYLKVAGNGSNVIGLAFTNGHPRDVLTSVYYAAYRNGSLWRPGGTWITRVNWAPIAPRQASIVYDANKTHVPAWVWDVAIGPDGRPVIVYATFPPGAQHVYCYARFDGRRWISHRLTSAGGSISPGTTELQYSGGVALDHTQPSTVYLSRQVHGGWQIERWTSPDGGAHWRRTVVVPADGTENVRPVVPRGYTGGPVGLLWLRGVYGTYTDYRTSIAFTG
ncbi:MAG: BNR-4 repeat-containing protein [Solirubrobacteraceae bacterium]